jgi:hypothetical protein
MLGDGVVEAAVILVLAASKHAFPPLRQPKVNSRQRNHVRKRRVRLKKQKWPG